MILKWLVKGTRPERGWLHEPCLSWGWIKYLGIDINNRLNFKTNTQAVFAKGRGGSILK